MRRLICTLLFAYGIRHICAWPGPYYKGDNNSKLGHIFIFFFFSIYKPFDPNFSKIRIKKKVTSGNFIFIIWAAPNEFGTYRLCEQRRFRRACASAQSRQNLRCSLIQAVNQEEPSDRKPDPWPLWMAGHAQLKFVMTECSKTQIRLTGPISSYSFISRHFEIKCTQKCGM